MPVRLVDSIFIAHTNAFNTILATIKVNAVQIC